jgi:DNA-binding GntR family transcriptional regulator
MLTMRRTTFDDRGLVVEYGDHLYRASRYSFEVALTGR